jgi:hypothetical protein
VWGPGDRRSARRLSRRLDQSLGRARGVYIAGLSVARTRARSPIMRRRPTTWGSTPSSAGGWRRHPHLPAAPRHPRYSREPTPPGARRWSEGRTGQGRVWLMSAVGGRKGAPLGLGGADARPDGGAGDAPSRRDHRLTRALTAGLLHRRGNPVTRGRLLAKSLVAYLRASAMAVARDRDVSIIREDSPPSGWSPGAVDMRWGLGSCHEFCQPEGCQILQNRYEP